MFRDKINNAFNYYRNYGLLKSIQHSFKVMRSGFKRLQLIFFEISLDEFKSWHANNNDLELVRLKKENIEREGYQGGWITHEDALNRLAVRNCILFVLRNKGEPVTYHWIEFGEVDLSFFDISVLLDNKTVYSSHLFTVPGHRGKGFASEIKSRDLKYLKDKGYRKVFIVIVPDNAPSIRVNKKAGFKEYQKVTYIKILFIKLFFVKKWQTSKRKLFFYFKNKDNKMWQTFSRIN